MKSALLTAEDRELLKHLPVLQSAPDAARFLGITYKALDHKRRRGKIRAKKDGRVWAYETVELLRYKNRLRMG